MLNAIIVDDEANAREKLSLLIADGFPNEINVVAVCANGQDALKAIGEHKPELLFLDVEMPHMSGFDVLRNATPKSFDVIFTTAYDHYAIKAIKFAAIDYLLKPIDIDQLREAVTRVKEKRGLSGSAQRVDQLLEDQKHGGQPGRLSVPGKDGFVLVNVDDIVWCEAVNYYTVLHLKGDKQLVATRTLKEFEDILEGPDFLRIHRGHMIHMKHLERYIKGAGGQVVMAGGRTLDVSRTRKDELMARIGRN
jgi:two-component system, LytTR family, response regulator